MDTIDLAHWLKELAQQVEAQAGRLDILEGKRKGQPVDSRLVEKALETALALKAGFVDGSWMGQQFASIIALLRRALEGGSNAQD